MIYDRVMKSLEEGETRIESVRVAGHNNLRGWNLFGVILYILLCLFLNKENNKRSSGENVRVV